MNKLKYFILKTLFKNEAIIKDVDIIAVCGNIIVRTDKNLTYENATIRNKNNTFGDSDDGYEHTINNPCEGFDFAGKGVVKIISNETVAVNPNYKEKL